MAEHDVVPGMARWEFELLDLEIPEGYVFNDEVQEILEVGETAVSETVVEQPVSDQVIVKDGLTVTIDESVLSGSGQSTIPQWKLDYLGITLPEGWVVSPEPEPHPEIDPRALEAELSQIPEFQREDKVTVMVRGETCKLGYWSADDQGPKFWAMRYKEEPYLKLLYDQAARDGELIRHDVSELDLSNLSYDTFAAEGVIDRLAQENLINDPHDESRFHIHLEKEMEDRDDFEGFGNRAASCTFNGPTYKMEHYSPQCGDRPIDYIAGFHDPKLNASVILTDATYEQGQYRYGPGLYSQCASYFDLAAGSSLRFEKDSHLTIIGDKVHGNLMVGRYPTGDYDYENGNINTLSDLYYGDSMTIAGDVTIKNSMVKGFGRLKNVKTSFAIIDNKESASPMTLSGLDIEQAGIIDRRVSGSYDRSTDTWELDESSPENEIKIVAPEGEVIELKDVYLAFYEGDLGMDVRKQSDLQVINHPDNPFDAVVMYRAGNGEVRFQECLRQSGYDYADSYEYDADAEDSFGDPRWYNAATPWGVWFHERYEAVGCFSKGESIDPPEWAYDYVIQHVQEIDPNYDVESLMKTLNEKAYGFDPTMSEAKRLALQKIAQVEAKYCLDEPVANHELDF